MGRGGGRGGAWAGALAGAGIESGTPRTQSPGDAPVCLFSFYSYIPGRREAQ